ncbi:MAG TPA: uracil-DNA glycosylase [Lacipirellulaceae bacterium]
MRSSHQELSQWAKLNSRIEACRECERLVEWCQRVAREKRAAYREWEYWGRPVPNFGDPAARLLIVGLAPGAHGANRTGRMFTGDSSGLWLYRALAKAGFANQAQSESRDDGLTLVDCAITAAVHCAPPDNMPSGEERERCRAWLLETFDLLPVKVIVALGGLAWQESVRQVRRRGWYSERRPKFAHGAKVAMAGGRWLLASYHPSRQNTHTRRLTEPMLDAVFAEAKRLLKRREKVSR